MNYIAERRQHGAGQHDRDERPEGVSERSLHAERGEEIERRVHAEHHEIALGEVDHPHDAEDQPESDAHQAIDRADQKSGGQCLQEAFQRLGHRRPRVGRKCPSFVPAVGVAISVISGLNIVLPIFCCRCRS